MLTYQFFMFFFMISPSRGFASKEIPCEQFTSVREVIQCALQTHPDSRIAQAALDQGRALEDVAAQRANPELNSQAVLGTSPESPFSYIELNFAHNFELGGKRDARIGVARAEIEQRRASVLGAREQVYIATLLSLYRIRQLQTELEILNGALDSFSSIQKHYKTRPKLTPDQTASLRIFEVAEADYKLRRTPLETAVDRDLHELEYALGKPFVPTKGLLPKRKLNWPKFSESVLNQPAWGAQVQTSLSNLKYAESQVELAKSNAWPDLRLGPTFQNQNQGLSSFNAYGINFTLLLPVFHSNGAGTAYAFQGVNKAEISLQATQKEARDERIFFLRRYQRAVKALENSIDLKELDKKHDEVESLFNRGLLAGTFVIEIHRQMFDFVKDQNEQELAAIESLAKYYAYQGRLFEEDL